MKRYFRVLLSLVVIMFFVSCNNGAKPVISKTATDGNINSGEEDKEKKDSAELKSKESEASKEKKPEVKSNNSDGKNSKDEGKNKVIVEGISESIETEVKKSNFGYTITYDKNRFKFQNGEGADSFMAPNSDSSIFPNVFLSVAKIEGQSLDEIMNGLMLQAGQEGAWQNTIIGQGKYKAKKFIFKEGNNYNSRVCEYYLTEKESKVYLIEINYFVEAEEGYGARLHGMLDTFTFN